MRHHTVILAGLLGLGCSGGQVAAQVSFDPRALSPLQQQTPATPPAAPAPQSAAPAPQSGPESGRRTSRTPPQHATPQRRAAPAKPAPAPKPTAPPTPTTAPSAAPSNQTATRPAPTRPTQTPGRPTAPARPPDSRNVVVPKAPPAPVALPPPPVVVPARPPPPPSPVAVLPDAPGEAVPIAGGTRITFGPGGSDLNPTTDTAIKTLMHAAPRSDTTTFTVTAYAQGTPEDPSTARRLSLGRALAVRSVLITEGVASVRIYVKALGPPSAAVPQSLDGPPDRVDIVVAVGQPPTPAKAP